MKNFFCFVFLCSLTEVYSTIIDTARLIYQNDEQHINTHKRTYKFNNHTYKKQKASNKNVKGKNTSYEKDSNEIYANLYDKYCDAPDLFLKDLKTKNEDYVKVMIQLLREHNFFYSSWTQDKIKIVEQSPYVKEYNMTCDDSFWNYVGDM